MAIDARQLFIAVADRKSISRVSEELNISQSTISTSLGKLESMLGVKLFDRTKYPLELTYAGYRYYYYALQLRTAEDVLERKITNLAMNGQEKLRIGMSAWKSAFFVRHIMPRILADFPDISLEIRQGDIHTLEQLLLSREVDVCLINTLRFNEKIIYNMITSERIFLAAPVDHPVTKRHPTNIDSPSYLDIRELENERFFLNRPNQPIHKTITNFFYKHNTFPRYVTYTSLSLSQLQLVATGSGFCFLPEFGWVQQDGLEKVTRYTVDTPALDWPLSIAYLNGHSFTLAEKAFVDVTTDLLTK